MADPAKVDILLSIEARLGEILRAQGEMKRMREETARANDEQQKWSTLFKQGIGIGSGMEAAQRAVALFRATVMTAFSDAFRLASEIKDGSEALSVTGEQYQVIQIELQKAGVEMGRFAAAASTQTRSLAAARDGVSGAAQAYKTLGLNAAAVEQMGTIDRVLAIVEAMRKATDQTAAFGAAGVILGPEKLSPLMLALKDTARSYSDVAKAAKESGQIISKETADAVDAASKKLEEFRKSMTVTAANAIEQGTKLWNLFGTPWNEMTAAQQARTATNKSDLNAKIEALRARDNPSAPDAPGAAMPDAFPDAATARRDALRAAQFRFSVISGARANYEADGSPKPPQDANRISLLREEIAARTELLELTRAAQEYDTKGNREEQTLALVEGTAGLVKTINELAEAEGRGAKATEAAAQERRELVAIQAEEAVKQALIAAANKRAEEERKARLDAADAETAKKNAAAEREAALVTKQAAVSMLQDETSRTASRSDIDPAVKQQKLLDLYERTRAAMAEVVALKEEELRLSAVDDPVKRAQLNADISTLTARMGMLGTGDPASGIAGYRERANARLNGDSSISAREGVEAGALNYVAQLGSQGEQIAGALQSTIGTAVSSIGDGIYGWITGANSFADSMRNLGATVLRTVLNTIVQMGAQMLIVAAIKKITDKEDQEATKKNIAGKAVEGGFKSIAQLGPIWGTLAFVAAAAAIMAMFGGFREKGGPVDAERSYVVGERGPELFVPTGNGTIIPAAETMRIRSGAMGGAGRAASASAAAARGGSVAGSPRMYLAMANSQEQFEEMRRLPGYEVHIIDTVHRNRGTLLG